MDTGIFTKEHLLWKTQSNETNIIINERNLRLSKIQNSYWLPSIWKNLWRPCCILFIRRWIFRTNCSFTRFDNLVPKWPTSHNFEAKLTKYDKRFEVVFFTEGQNTEKLRATDSLFSESQCYENTRFEVLQEVNRFCNEQLPHQKTQFEDIPFRYQGGFSTHICLAEDRNVFDNPISWGKNEVFKSWPSVITVVDGIKKTSECRKCHGVFRSNLK